MNSKQNIFIIRHGESEWNRKFRIQGNLDSELSLRGIDQSKRTALKLSVQDIQKIYSSPLKRTFQTAQKISKAVKAEIEVIDELKELDFGEVQGLTFEEAEKLYPGFLANWANDPSSMSIKGMEDLKDFQERIARAYDIIMKNNNLENICIVTHTGVIGALFSIILEFDIEKMWVMYSKNCSISHIEKYDDVYRFKFFNNLSHLE